MEFILAYILIMDVGTKRIEYRQDKLFPSKYHCQLFANSEQNKKYMQTHYKGKDIRMVYPACSNNPYQPEPIGMTGWSQLSAASLKVSQS